MSTEIHPIDLDLIEYPDSDGEPLAENNEQLRLIFLIKSELDAIFAEAEVAVEGDLFWYPVQGDNNLRRAPDVMVIFGRPKRYRGSYKQWREGGIAPQVAFEILSPSNDAAEMLAKRNFYETYGVEEYYEYDPERLELRGWRRVNGFFQPIEEMNGWVSPRLGIRFEIDQDGQLLLFRPDGQTFRSFTELENLLKAEQQRVLEEHYKTEEQRLRVLQEQQRAEREERRAKQEQERADRERQRAEQEKRRTEQQKIRAEQAQEQAERERIRAEQERLRAEQEQQKAEQERLRAEQEQQKAEQERLRAEQERQEKAALQKQLEAERQRIEQLMAELQALKDNNSDKTNQ
jgi:Uma2 family endonuclease